MVRDIAPGARKSPGTQVPEFRFTAVRVGDPDSFF